MSEPVNSDAQQLAQFGYKQELHRTLGSFSSFAAGFSYISILTGMFQTAALGFFFAGPAFAWFWLVVLFGQFMVALQFAELSAHYPLAGSVYQWSKQVAGKAWAWNTGWMYLCAQIVTVPAVALAWQIILPQISPKFQLYGSSANSANYFSTDFAANAVILGLIMVVLTTTINVMGVSVLSRINNIGVASELVGGVGPRHHLPHPCQPQPGRRAHQHGRHRCQSPVGVLRRAPDRGDHAALRDVRLRHGRVAGRGDG